jgi:hypothetical protein
MGLSLLCLIALFLQFVFSYEMLDLMFLPHQKSTSSLTVDWNTRHVLLVQKQQPPNKQAILPHWPLLARTPPLVPPKTSSDATPDADAVTTAAGGEDWSSNSTSGWYYDDSMTTATTMESESESNSKNANYKQNPHVFGWTPDMFPNPAMDPLRCAISYLHLLPRDEDTDDDAVEDAAGVDAANTTTTPPTKHSTKTAAAVLRLCDPDWVLGGVYLEQIAAGLYNFSNVFRNYNEAAWDDNSDAPWDVAVGPSVRRRRLISDAWLDTRQRLSVFVDTERVELAVAVVQKMNLQAVLRQGSYYTYEDEDDMVNDAAQIFARSLHDNWWRSPACIQRAAVDPTRSKEEDEPDDEDPPPNSNTNNHRSSNPHCANNNTRAASHGILMFLSIQDRVCFISTGSAVSSILPWWRLDHIVASMKPDLRRHEYGDAVLNAMNDLQSMLLTGPPTFLDRMHDFLARFGVVICFALGTFIFGLVGEYRDRRKKWHYAEQRSKLSGMEWEKARLLQREYQTKSCPICLEVFPGMDGSSEDIVFEHDYTFAALPDNAKQGGEKSKIQPKIVSRKDTPDDGLVKTSSSLLRRVDTYGIPLNGADNKRIKLLRCGHVFCETCYKSWIFSGCGNPCNCPMCRQDVGKAPKKRAARYFASSNNNNASAADAEEERTYPIPLNPSQQQESGQAGSRPSTYGSLTNAAIPFGALFRGTAANDSAGGETAPLLDSSNSSSLTRALQTAGGGDCAL